MSKKHYISIEEGVSPYQVIQRGPDDRADIRFAGSTTAPNGTTVEARLLRYGKPTARFPWEAVGQVSHSAFGGLLPAVPTGGVYTLEVRASGKGSALATAACPGILVGDLWVLAGQSNMHGCGRLDAADIVEPNTLVHAFDMSDRWPSAKDAPTGSAPGWHSRARSCAIRACRSDSSPALSAGRPWTSGTPSR